MRLILLGLVVALVVFAVSAAGAAVAAPTASPSRGATTTVRADGPQLARIGFGARGFGTRGFGGRRSSSRRPGFGYRPRSRRGRGFLRGLFHGLFWGWVLSHLFGGGFPLVLPLLALVFFMMAMRRRRPPTYHRW